MLTGVPAAGDAEAKIKVKVLQKSVSEVMPLDHTEVGYGLVSHGELHPAGREEGELNPQLENLSRVQDRNGNPGVRPSRWP